MLYITNAAAEQVRVCCRMTDPVSDPEKGPWFDPDSPSEVLKPIVLFPRTKISEEDRFKLVRLFRALDKETLREETTLVSLEEEVPTRIFRNSTGLSADAAQPFLKEKTYRPKKCSYTKCGKIESIPKSLRKCRKCVDLNIATPSRYCGEDCQVNDW